MTTSQKAAEFIIHSTLNPDGTFENVVLDQDGNIVSETKVPSTMKLQLAAKEASLIAHTTADPMLEEGKIKNAAPRSFEAIRQLRIFMKTCPSNNRVGLRVKEMEARLESICDHVEEIQNTPRLRASVREAAGQIYSLAALSLSSIGSGDFTRAIPQGRWDTVRDMVNRLPTVEGLPASDAEDKVIAIRAVLEMHGYRHVNEAQDPALKAVIAILDPTIKKKGAR